MYRRRIILCITAAVVRVLPMRYSIKKPTHKYIHLLQIYMLRREDVKTFTFIEPDEIS